MKHIFLFFCLIASSTYAEEIPDEFAKLTRRAAEEKTAEAYLYVTEYGIRHKAGVKLLNVYWDSAYHAAVKEKSDIYLGMLYYQKGNYYSDHYPDSTRTFRDFEKKALFHYQKTNVKDVIPYLNMRIGMSFLTSGYSDSAIFYLDKTLKYIHANPKNNIFPVDEMKKLSLQFTIQAHLAKGEYKQGLNTALELNDLSTQMKDSVSLAANAFTIGVIYENLKDNANAFTQFVNAASLSEKIKDYTSASANYRRAALIKSALNELDAALKLNDAAMKNARLGKDKASEASSWDTYASIYQKQGKNEEAIAAYRKALDIYESTDDKNSYKFTYTALMELFAETNKQDSAWTYMKKLEDMGFTNLLNDSLSIPGALQNERLQRMLADFTSNERKAKYDILNEQYIKQENTMLKQRIRYIVAVAVLIILLLLLLYNRQRQKTKAEQMSRYASEKENQYKALQQETELRLTKKYIDGLENERERMAKELHDGTCNDLLALEMELKTVSENDKTLRQSLDMLRQTRENVRFISHQLMPPAFQYANLDEMLADYTSHLDIPSSITLNYHSENDADWETIPKEIAYESYRIVQEGLNNALKHAKATRIDLYISLKDNSLIIKLTDNGIGFDTAKKQKGIGLQTITERVKSINGNKQLTSNEAGTVLQVDVKMETR